jgi:Putative polyhydroxyalkanoic acid system protein (PHA_gran_rgn)
MSKPLVVSIPHRLGKEEAMRRLKSGLAGIRTDFAHVFTVSEETWNQDHLRFRIIALAQAVSGSIDVTEDNVHLEISLPWLLAKLAETLQPLIRREGTLMLEKK